MTHTKIYIQRWRKIKRHTPAQRLLALNIAEKKQFSHYCILNWNAFDAWISEGLSSLKKKRIFEIDCEFKQKNTLFWQFDRFHGYDNWKMKTKHFIFDRVRRVTYSIRTCFWFIATNSKLAKKNSAERILNQICFFWNCRQCNNRNKYQASKKKTIRQKFVQVHRATLK